MLVGRLSIVFGVAVSEAAGILVKGSNDNLEVTSERRKLLQDSKALFLASLVERGLGAWVGIIVAKVLGPADFGILKVISHVPTLIKYGAVGFSALGKREVPLMRESGVPRVDQELLLGRVLTADLIWSLVLALAVLVTSAFYSNTTIVGGLIIVSFGIIVSQVSKCLDVIFCIEQNFTDIARATVMGGGVSAIFTMLTLEPLGMYSVLLASIVGGVVTCSFLFFKLPTPLPKPSFNLSFLASASRVAVPISLTTLSSGLMGWAERILVLAFFTPSILGLYMFIVFIIDLFSTIINSAMKAAAIKIFSRVGASKNDDFDLVLLPSIIISILFSFCGGVLALLGPRILNSYLPEYADIGSVLVFVVLILVCNGATAFIAVAMQSRTLNQQLPLSLLSLIMVLVFSVAMYVSSFYLNALEAIIVGKISATLFRSSGIIFLTFHHFFRNITYLGGFLFCIFSPLVLFMIPAVAHMFYSLEMSWNFWFLAIIYYAAALAFSFTITRHIFQLTWTFVQKKS